MMHGSSTSIVPLVLFGRAGQKGAELGCSRAESDRQKKGELIALLKKLD